MPFRQVVPCLTGDQIAGMYETCLHFLETKGFKIESDSLLPLLAERGADMGVVEHLLGLE